MYINTLHRTNRIGTEISILFAESKQDVILF